MSASSAREAVAALYPSQVLHPSSNAFLAAQKSFWNATQQCRTPACIFQPTNADQVKAALIEVRRAGCLFAIKGGGHSSNHQGSSIQDGFQFDLVNLNHVKIADDNKSVSVGPGVKWGPLYKMLEERGLMAVGGRDFGVGVPGFIFGGGISYYSAQHGWGVDNLVSVDIVLANGELIVADSACHPELSKALHGGGAHNFGIVTSMTLKLYPYSGMWGGLNVVTEEHFDALFDAYDVYTHELMEDRKAHIILDITRQDGQIIAAQFMGYSEPSADPRIFQGFRNIPTIINTLRLADVSDLATEMAEVTNSQGKRNAYWTLAIEYDIILLRSIYKLWAVTTEPIADRFNFTLDINHITPAMRNQASREGLSNVYGLEGSNKPVVNILLTVVWENESDDVEVTASLKSLGVEIEEMSIRRGKGHKFKYMNYANQEQDVTASFGEKNKIFLQEVATKYDPDGVFQRLNPGTFKLGQCKN